VQPAVGDPASAGGLELDDLQTSPPFCDSAFRLHRKLKFGRMYAFSYLNKEKKVVHLDDFLPLNFFPDKLMT